MSVETERKFLVVDGSWRVAASKGRRVEQGYLALDHGTVVRVRVVDRQQGWLTVKGPRRGISRDEFDYPIPAAEGEELLRSLARFQLSKERFDVMYEGTRWTVDVFDGANRGLTIAEVELADADAPVVIPPWAGEEVTGDERYDNSSLARRPFSAWPAETGALS
jgi:adenylate cyclase